MIIFRMITICSMIISLLFINSIESWSSEIHWKDFREPVRDIRVYHNENANINLDLPEDFINDKEYVTLVINVLSQVRKVGDVEKTQGFLSFNPVIKVNDHFFAYYKVPTNDTPLDQTHEIEIKSKYLKAGRNTLTANYKWKGNAYNAHGRCAYIIKKMFFKNAPPSSYSLSISSNPAGAFIYLDGIYRGKTNIDFNVEPGVHTIELKKDDFLPLTETLEISENGKYSYVLQIKEVRKSVIQTEQENADIDKQVKINLFRNLYLKGEITSSQFDRAIKIVVSDKQNRIINDFIDKKISLETFKSVF